MKKFAIFAVVALLFAGCRHTSDDSMMMNDSKMMMGTMNIPEVAMSDDNFGTLVKLLKAADLVDTLKGKGPFTVFAPTDAAFAKLPAGTVESLMQPSNRERLRAILMNHVVPGRVTAAEVMKMKTARTAGGATLNIMTMGDGVMVGNANVIKADIAASNGIVHAIDTVLMPSGTM